MPYIDSSHTELLRIGSLDPDFGGTTIEQVYEAMDSLSFPPFAIYPEFVKGGGGGHSGDDGDSSVPSGDVTLIVSVVDTYEDGDSYSSYEDFLDNLFDAMDGVGGGPCMDDHDTDPHVSMARGVKFKSSYHQQQYFYKANLEVSVWQAMYPKGVVIGSNSYASFPPDSGSRNKMYVGYGNLYFFFDRANITKAFEPNRYVDRNAYCAQLCLLNSFNSENFHQQKQVTQQFTQVANQTLTTSPPLRSALTTTKGLGPTTMTNTTNTIHIIGRRRWQITTLPTAGICRRIANRRAKHSLVSPSPNDLIRSCYRRTHFKISLISSTLQIETSPTCNHSVQTMVGSLERLLAMAQGPSLTKTPLTSQASCLRFVLFFFTTFHFLTYFPPFFALLSSLLHWYHKS